MNRNNDNLNGAITGIAIAAATHWARYDEDTQRRLRNVRLDAEEALELIRDMQSRGEVIRSRMPIVMDAQVGLAIASPQPTSAAVIPTGTPLARPDLTTQMETAVADMTFPPEPGEYDDRGMVKQAGELTSLFVALTYEENRAFLQGLAQSRPPSREAKVQIYYAANALVAALCERKLTWEQYKERWARLLTQEESPPPSPNLHTDVKLPPSVQSLGAGVASVVPLTSLPGGVAGYPYANRNTDKAMRFRITTKAPVGPDTVLASIHFGSEFRDEGEPFQPVVLVNGDVPFYAVSVSSRSFVVKCTQGLANAQAYDLFAATVGPNGG